jgi:hypothetical protein
LGAIKFSQTLMKRILLLCFLLPLLSITECKKDNRTHYTIPPESLPYYVFQKNSYWVYQKSNSNETDSTYVAVDPYYYTEGADPQNEMPWRDYIIITFKSNFIESFSISPDEAVLLETHDQGFEPMFFYPQIEYFITTSKNVFQILGSYDTLRINNHIFHNVYHTRYTKISSCDSNKYDFFIAKNVGLVSFERRVCGTDILWTVLRWHVNQ